MGIQNGLDLFETVARQSRNLRCRATGDSKPCYSRAAQIVEREAINPSGSADCSPR